MSRKLIVHIGAPKCGSTYLQRVLLRNRETLSASGIAYPHNGGRHPGNGMTALAMLPEDLSSLFDNHHTAVFSHEDLFGAAPRARKFARAVKDSDLEVVILAFLRPFSEFIFGDYSQFIKQGLEQFMAERRAFGGRGFEQFAVDRSHMLTCNGFLRQWQDLFPDADLILKSHRSLRTELGRLLGVSAIDWQVPSDQANPSLRMEDCDRIVAAINDPDIAPAEIHEMMKTALKKTGGRDAGRTAIRTAWIEALFQRQNEALLRNFQFDNTLDTNGRA